MTSGNYFRDYLLLTEDKLMTKMDHYLDVYHRLLAPWRSQDINFFGNWRLEGWLHKDVARLFWCGKPVDLSRYRSGLQNF